MAVFTGNGSAGAPSFTFSSDTDTGMWRPNANQLAFNVGGSNKLFINSTGLGIGDNNSPKSVLDVSGGVSGGTDTAGPTLTLTNKSIAITTTDIVMGAINFYTSDSSNAGTFAKIDAISNRIFDGGSTSGMHLRFFAGDVGDGANTPPERARFTPDGYFRMASGSGGIQFNGDTAAANALDDYEEGTFTPQLRSAFNFNLAVMSASGNYGTYRKIGKLVMFWARIAWDDASTMLSGGGVGLRPPFSLGFSSEYDNQTVGRVTYRNTSDFTNEMFLAPENSFGRNLNFNTVTGSTITSATFQAAASKVLTVEGQYYIT